MPPPSGKEYVFAPGVTALANTPVMQRVALAPIIEPAKGLPIVKRLVGVETIRPSAPKFIVALRVDGAESIKTEPAPAATITAPFIIGGNSAPVLRVPVTASKYSKYELEA